MYVLGGGERGLSRKHVKARRAGFLSAQTAPPAKPRPKISRPALDTLAKEKGFALRGKIRLIDTPAPVYTIRAITANGLIFYETGKCLYNPKLFELLP